MLFLSRLDTVYGGSEARWLPAADLFPILQRERFAVRQ